MGFNFLSVLTSSLYLSGFRRHLAGEVDELTVLVKELEATCKELAEPVERTQSTTLKRTFKTVCKLSEECTEHLESVILGVTEVKSLGGRLDDSVAKLKKQKQMTSRACLGKSTAIVKGMLSEYEEQATTG